MNYSTPSHIRPRDIIAGKPELSFLKNNSDSSPVGIKFDNISAGKFEALFINNNTSQHLVLNNHTETVDRLGSGNSCRSNAKAGFNVTSGAGQVGVP